MASKAFLEKAYLAYFGRPVDATGAIAFQNSTEAQVQAAFAASPESVALYGATFSQTQINAIYNMLFGRDAEPAGLSYWTNQVALGLLTPAGAALGILNGALNADATAVANKLVASASFTAGLTTTAQILGYSGDAAAASARTFLQTVTATAATATQIADAVAATTALGTGGVAGSTFALSTGTDILTGTAGNDTFSAGVTMASNGTTLVDTLQSIDSLTGGAGTDTLNATLNGGAIATPTLSGIEIVNVRATAAGSGVSLAGATGVTNVNSANSTAVATLQSIAGAAVGISNQTQNVNINGSTATALTLGLTNVGTAAADILVDLGSATANAATSFAITAKDAHVTFTETTASAATTSATVAATGANEITFAAADLASLTSLSVTGTGSVDFTGGAFTALTTLTAADGGVKVNATGGVLDTVTTGAGADTVTAVGATVKNIATGAGNDTVTAATTGLAATSVVDLGAGDDSVTLAAAPTAGATLTGGLGTDTLNLTVAGYGLVSAFTAANLAKITGFEVLGFTDALAAAGSYDVSKIAGVGSVKLGAGVTALSAATVTGLGAAATVEIAGVNTTGTLTVTQTTDTAADSITLKLNNTYTENNDATTTTALAAQGVTATLIETVNVVSTGKASTAFLGATGNKADAIANTLTLTDVDLVTLNVTGDQAFTINTANTQTKLATVDASALTAAATINAAANVTATNAAMTIKGSATAANALTGSSNADTIIGGAKADTITGGAGADAITGGAGNDVFVIAAFGDSTLIKMDVISDFSANTFGQGTAGAANQLGATATLASRTGDVIDLSAAAPTNLELSVQANAADAQTAIQNAATDATYAAVNIALDSSTSKLYVDFDNNGTIDTVLQLTGVTTITTAAFVI